MRPINLVIRIAALALVGFLAVPPSSFAQTLDWAKSAGGISNEQGRDIATDRRGDSYDRNGRLLWATSAGGSGEDVGTGIAMVPRGKSFVAGIFSNTATFGEGETNETELAAVGRIDVFIASFGSTFPDRRLATSAGRD